MIIISQKTSDKELVNKENQSSNEKKPMQIKKTKHAVGTQVCNGGLLEDNIVGIKDKDNPNTLKAIKTSCQIKLSIILS